MNTKTKGRDPSGDATSSITDTRNYTVLGEVQSRQSHSRVCRNGPESQGSGVMATTPLISSASRQHIAALPIAECSLAVTLMFKFYKMLGKRWEAAV